MATLLIVGDRPMNRHFLATLLGSQGHRIVEAADGALALAAVRAKMPDLVITDIMMPNMNGIEFVHKLREEAGGAKLPVVFYTATFLVREARTVAAQYGVLRVLSKPSKPALILATVQELLAEPVRPNAESAADAVLVAPEFGESDLSVHLAGMERELQGPSDILERVRERSEQAADGDALFELGLPAALDHILSLSLRLTTLVELGVAFANERDPQQLVTTAVSALHGLLFCQNAAVALISEGDAEPRYFGALGFNSAEEAAIRAASGGGLYAREFSSGEVVRFNGASADASALGLSPDLPPRESVLVAPILASKRAIGWICVGNRYAGDGFSELDERVIGTVAAQLGVAYGSLDLYERLQRSRTRSGAHAARLEGLLRILNEPSLDEYDRWMAMLRHAAGAILPDQPYLAMLGRIAGEEIVVEAMLSTSDNAQALSRARFDRIPVAGSLVEPLRAVGVRTRVWQGQAQLAAEAPATFERGIRSALATTFNAGAEDWLLTFVSSNQAPRGFGPDDVTFVELLASFFANHVQQRWQFARIEQQQSHDLLTGLLNRSQFRSQARLVSHATPRFAIIKIDVSKLGEINEAYGHMFGDAMLVEVATALSGRARAGELIGRVSGDVFGIYVPDPASKEYVRARALEFAGAFATPFSTGDRAGTEFIALTASIGIAVAPADGDEVDAIMSHADAALVTSKRQGSGALMFFERGMEGDAQFNAALRTEISVALAENQFVLYFQPHVDLQTGDVLGCECLIRWQHPARGLLLPAAFIPFAERSGLIAGIDDWGDAERAGGRGGAARSAARVSALLQLVRPSCRLARGRPGLPRGREGRCAA